MFGGMDHLEKAQEARERAAAQKAQQDAEAAAAAEAAQKAHLEAAAEEAAEDAAEEEPIEAMAALSVNGEAMGGRTEGDLTREEMMEFFAKNEEMLTSDPVRLRLKKLAKGGGKGVGQLNKILVDMQRAVFPAMGIDKDFGCQNLNTIMTKFPEDDELQEGLKNFAVNCSAAYLTAIRDAKPKKPRKSGKMSLEDIMNFTDACNGLMMQKSTQEALRAEFLKTKALPNQMVIEFQWEMLETLGVQKDFGVSCLNNIGRDFPPNTQQNQMLHQKMQMFMNSAQDACMKSQMTPEQVKEAEKEMRENGPQQQQQVQAMQAEQMRQQQMVMEAVSMMNETEKQALKDKMLPKFAAISKLSQQERRTYMERQSNTDKLDLSKINIIMMQEMQALQEAGASKETIMALLQSYQSGVQAMKKVREGGEPEAVTEASPPPAGAASSAAEGTAATEDPPKVD